MLSWILVILTGALVVTQQRTWYVQETALIGCVVALKDFGSSLCRLVRWEAFEFFLGPCLIPRGFRVEAL